MQTHTIVPSYALHVHMHACMCAHLHLPAHYRHACAHKHQSPKVVRHNYCLPTPFSVFLLASAGL